MYIFIVLMRAIHVASGVFWAGAMIFNANFLIPAMAEAGPAAGAVMAGLMKRKMLTVIPIAAILAILSGGALFWNDSAGFTSDFMGTRMGISLSIGATLALVAFIIGMLVMRSSTLKAIALTQSVAQQADGPDKQAVMGQAQALRVRAAKAARAVAALLGVTILLMGVARYL